MRDFAGGFLQLGNVLVGRCASWGMLKYKKFAKVFALGNKLLIYDNFILLVLRQLL